MDFWAKQHRKQQQCKSLVVQVIFFVALSLQRSHGFVSMHLMDQRGQPSATTPPGSDTLRWSQVSETQESEPSVFFSPNVPLDRKRGTDESTANITGNHDAEAEYSFFDQASIVVQAGSGGQGASTYKRTKGGQRGPPDGGNGGRGGHVILVADPSLGTLSGLASPSRPQFFRGANGDDGARGFKSGKFGKNSVVRVPPGTVIHESGVDGEEGPLLGKLRRPHEELIVAQGGVGGEGSAVVPNTRGVTRPRSPPTKGERRQLQLTLELIADVALVGVPNAGKSTLLSAVTRAQPKIANYPFTTVIPNLGVWNSPQGSGGLVLCDVPGLIQGAADGVGLGHAFLRHVERCHVILHLIDATSNDPVADYQMLNQEMVAYGTGQLAQMPQVVVVNKVDAYEEDSGEEWEYGLKAKFSKEELRDKLMEVMPHSRLLWMSAKEKDGVDDLMARLAGFVGKVKEAEKAKEAAD